MSHVLGLFSYDNNIDKFVPTEYMDLHIPFQNAISLSPTLEFYVIDSAGKIVDFNNLSQLFVSITNFKL